MKKLLFIQLSLLLAGCNTINEDVKKSSDPNVSKSTITDIGDKKSDQFYHYSIWYAFVNKVFDGQLTAAELKQNGDIGLGSYNGLDGELILLDGILYKASENGIVEIPNDSIKIAYANATFFDKDMSFDITEHSDYEKLRSEINLHMPSKNMFYGLKIHGRFEYMKCGGLHKQEAPYQTGLDVLLPNRPIFERNDLKGTMVGFFCPEFIGNINVAAYHLHFVSDDKKFAGHVLEFEAENLSVEMDEITEYKFILPNTEAYRGVGFDKEFQYRKK